MEPQRIASGRPGDAATGKCVECHGRVDFMAVVYPAAPMNMSFWLGCHASPEQTFAW
jgi:hypothetical protein